jgi:hypothetical protein
MPSRLAQIIVQKEGALLSDWMSQSQILGSQKHGISDSALRTICTTSSLPSSEVLPVGRLTSRVPAGPVCVTY